MGHGVEFMNDKEFDKKSDVNSGTVKNIVLSAMFLAIGILLPFVTAQIQEIGRMLLPMHIPVLLCGFICGPWYGAIVGFILPVLRSFLTGGIPPMMPGAVAMAFELLMYGLMAGLIYRFIRKNIVGLYISLIGAMLAGRIMWYLASLILFRMMDSVFTVKMFVAGAFLNAIPGIIIQLIIIPPIVMAIRMAERNQKGSI